MPESQNLVNEIVKQQAVLVDKCKQLRTLAKKLEATYWNIETKYLQFTEGTKQELIDLFRNKLQDCKFQY